MLSLWSSSDDLGALKLLFLYTIVHSCLSIDVVDITPSAEYTAGNEVALKCVVEPEDGEQVNWMKGETKLTENQELALPGSVFKDSFGRDYLTVSQAPGEGDQHSYILTFPEIRHKDAGTYMCNDNETVVTVINPKVISAVGSSVVLECPGLDIISENAGSGNAQLEVVSAVRWLYSDDGGNDMEVSTWASNGTSAEIHTNQTGISGLSSPTISRLNIDPVETSHQGTYTCMFDLSSGSKVEPYTWAIDFLVKVKPSKPGQPQLSSKTSSSLTVEWTLSEETITTTVSNYSIQYSSRYTYDQAGWTKPANTLNITGIPSDVNTSTITGLDGATKYAVRVIAWNEVGLTEGDTNAELETDIAKPNPPSVVFNPDIFNDKIIFSWTSRGVGMFTEFVFNLYPGASKGTNMTNSANIAKYPTDTREAEYRYKHIVPDLSPETAYCYEIISVNDGTSSVEMEPPCKPITTDTPAPTAPVLIDIKTGKVVNNSASVEIVFDPPECFFRDPNCLSYYTLTYHPENTTNPTVNSREFTKLDAVEATEKPNRMYTLTDLPLGYSYGVKLAGVVRSVLSETRSYTGEFSNTKSTDRLEGVSTLAPPTETTYNDTTVPDTTPIPPTTRERVPVTDPPVNSDIEIVIIVVTVCSVLIVLCIIAAVLVYRRKRGTSNMSVEQEDDLWIDLNTPLLGASSNGYVENDYENVGIDGWAEHCINMHANTDIKFAEEYESICKSQGQDISWKDSLEPANLPKNRYNNIVAYDHTRVVLKTQPGIVHSDYINGNYIDSYDKTRNFIATQGPLPNTIEDFWRMVWENNTHVIVMITNVYEKHKKKCEQYWPDSGESKYGRLTVTLLDTEELAYWTIRRFNIKTTKVSKKKHHIEKTIVQYHYTEWPDHGIPEYTLPVLSFVKRACNSSPIQAGPIVVHCSAGVGRTGTFIVLEAMMKQIMQKRTVNVQGFLRHIRGQRNHLVQTEDQYIFIHDALLNFIEGGGRTDIQPKKYRTMIDELDSNFDTSGETILEKQYKTIVKWSPPEHLTNCSLLDINTNKNRSLSYIPLDNSSRVKLPKVAGENGSDYINATYLHGHFQSKEFIITQHPAAHTEYDFWRMVWDQNSMTVVMLSNIGEEDLVTFFRPKGESTDWSHKSSFKLTFADENLESLEYAVRDFQLESKQDDYEMMTRMFSITCWPEAYTETQVYKEGVFQFIEVVNKWHAAKREQTGPIIVIDKYGGKVAAQFCALYTLYNQYHFDTEVDIYSLAYLYHKKRPGIWETQEDYRLLYNSMLQLCDPKLEDEKTNDVSTDKTDFPVNTFANVRRVNTLPRSPEHITRSDTM